MKQAFTTSTVSDQVTLSGACFPDGRPVRVRVAGGVVVGVDLAEGLPGGGGVERWVVPGFFDLQVNGFAGRDFTDRDLATRDVGHVAGAVLGTGTTRFLPTVVTGSLDVMCHHLSVIAEAMSGDSLVAEMCPGIHVEGPFIRAEDGPRGAHRREHVREPSVADFDRLNASAGGRIAMLTLAPERPGALELIRHVSERGVVVGLGHHRADKEAIDAAIEAGARLSTHLGNGTDELLPRHDNYLWLQLGEDRLWASMIADGFHLPASTLRCMLRAKTVGRTVLISDAIGAAGMPAGRYRLGDTEVERTEAGNVILPGTTYQAGSAADMPTVIGRAVTEGGVSFVDAVRMATLGPMEVMAGEPAGWSCERGQPANLVELDWRPADGRMTIRQVVTGKWHVKQD